MDRNDVSPLTRLLQRAVNLEPRETAAVITSFFLFFCVFAGYFAVRPVRETVGTILGAERTANLWSVTWIASLAIVPAYGWLCGRFRRAVFLPWIYGFVAVALLTCAFVLRANEGSLAAGRFFYVFISVLNLFIVSVFWSFLVELFSPSQARRLFGTIAAGGTAGALTGPIVTDLIVGRIGNAGILFLGAGLFFVAILLQQALLRIRAGHAWQSSASEVREDRPLGGNPFAGFRQVLRSPYLLGIALFVFFLASVSTFLYFAQLRIVADTFADTAQRTRVFSRIDYTVQSLTIILQLLFTGRLASRFGVGVLLTAVPVTMVGGFLLLSAFHVFAVLALVMIVRRVGEYAFVRPGREMLWSAVTTEEKYKAKNIIDVPVYRGADAFSAQVDKALAAGGLSPSAVAVIGAGVAGAWAVNGFLLGRTRRKAELVEERA